MPTSPPPDLPAEYSAEHPADVLAYGGDSQEKVAYLKHTKHWYRCDICPFRFDIKRRDKCLLVLRWLHYHSLVSLDTFVAAEDKFQRLDSDLMTDLKRSQEKLTNFADIESAGNGQITGRSDCTFICHSDTSVLESLNLLIVVFEYTTYLHFLASPSELPAHGKVRNCDWKEACQRREAAAIKAMGEREHRLKLASKSPRGTIAVDDLACMYNANSVARTMRQELFAHSNDPAIAKLRLKAAEATSNHGTSGADYFEKLLYARKNFLPWTEGQDSIQSKSHEPDQEPQSESRVFQYLIKMLHSSIDFLHEHGQFMRNAWETVDKGRIPLTASALEENNRLCNLANKEDGKESEWAGMRRLSRV